MPANAETLEITRTFAAPRRLVFEVWSTAAHLEKFIAPDGFTATCTVDFRVGGVITIRMQGMGMDHTARGTYEEIVPGERIVYRFHCDGLEGAAIRSTLLFEDAPGGTRFTTRQEFPRLDTLTPEQRRVLEPAMQGAPIGWAQSLDHLEAYLRR